MKFDGINPSFSQLNGLTLYRRLTSFLAALRALSAVRFVDELNHDEKQ
jgi:hypothetical protein